MRLAAAGVITALAVLHVSTAHGLAILMMGVAIGKLWR